MNTCHLRVRHALPPGLCALLLASSLATSAMAAPFELPPLVAPASTEHHVGKVIWVELVTPDLAATERFYAGVFGWTFREIHAGRSDYAVALLDGRPIGGLFQKATPKDEHRQPAWLTFIAVSDVDAAKRTAVEHGAKVVFEPKTYPQRGRQAILTDPDGASFAILASSSGDPPDFLASPGEWIWSSLHASDAGADAAFYQAVECKEELRQSRGHE
jgi:predicted enzyme related to lactoylglutathione lyase